MPSKSEKVIIIGAGWSGLSAACYLAKNNYLVSLFESSKQIGGRARDIQLDKSTNFVIDNGQHLLIGAYRETNKILKLISADFNNTLKRQKLKLDMYGANNDRLHINAYNLPAPFNLLFGILFCASLSLSNKLRIIQFCIQLYRKSNYQADDYSVAELLQRHKQTDRIIKALWEPLCIATLNTPIKTASAKIFISVLRKSLLGRKSDSDFIFTTKGLSAIFPDPASTFLHQHHAKIKLSARATKIIIKNDAIEGVIVDNNYFSTNHLILAIPPYACVKLFSGHNKLKQLCYQLSQIHYQPICTIYLQYPENITMTSSMIGLWGTTVQWLFDRRMVNQKGLMAAIISASGPHMELSNDSLIKLAQAEIKQLYPHWPNPLYTKVIREKRATFNCSVGISKYRPYNKTPIKGLWLCGDYTKSDLPATLESAIISGKITATEIIKSSDYE